MPEPAGDAFLRARFRQEMLSRIVADPNHRLGFLVDRQAGTWRAISHLAEEPAMQAGHLRSGHAVAREGGRSALAVEDAEYNQKASWRGERQGAIFEKKAVDIDGVPVELATAKL